MNNASLILYSRDDCPLCDLAAAMLQTEQLKAEWVDIADSIALLEKYRDRIPVLRRPGSDEELDWPFTQADLLAFVA